MTTHACGDDFDELLRRHPSDWLPTLFDHGDVERFLRGWVIPRFGPDVWLEDIDDVGPPEWWLDVLEGRDVDELVDMISICKRRCDESGTSFERVLENVRHTFVLDRQLDIEQGR